MKNLNFTRRPSLFETIANIAAINHYRGQHSYWTLCKLTDDEILKNIETINKTGRNLNGWKEYGCRTFRCPNNNPTGYWNILKVIANEKDGIKRRDLCKKLNINSLSMQLHTLELAGLITLERKYLHKFSVTDFGKAYISAVYCEFMNI